MEAVWSVDGQTIYIVSEDKEFDKVKDIERIWVTKDR